MLLHASFGLACLLQSCGTTTALPTEQHPLNQHDRNNVQTVRAKLKIAEIIPTVIDDFLPSLMLSVRWSKKDAELGNIIKPEKLQRQPEITVNNIANTVVAKKTNLSYVITLTDPDAPSRDNPEWSEMCHWVATNVSVSRNSFSIPPVPEYALTKQTTSEHRGLDDVVKYKPPGPPKKSGKHRYVFLVFAAKNGTAETLHLSKPKTRQHWGTGTERGGVRNWASENGLVPVAANFIYAQHKEQ
ncbi:PEBP-like protein [Plenodomus tracheiphilus IPT5]|uniref:PEBP-like protein n=1 Tax=Plenodomus tracheiphilus IPT5 TaxID=1408161 RepID=A0A6A7B5F6_9PLEO|nr:PEBP-like protein [Plenodomus tracheiphilus IPT5]